jgi:hypothetical protein
MSPFLRRTRVTPGYRAAVADVLGSSHRHHEALAVYWAHEIGWRTEGSGDEMAALTHTAHRYGVDMNDVLAERGTPRPPLLPAALPKHRRGARQAVQSLTAENIA